jgi:hypothetical protein
VRPACGGGGVVGVGNGGPAAGGSVFVAWRRRAPTCLAFFFFFIFLCREYLGGARQRAGDAVSLGTTVDPFSLTCVTYYARQRTVSCVAFSQIARQSSLPGKNASGALCRALGQNAHGKGGAVRIPVFVVRRRRMAKSAIPIVYAVFFPLRTNQSYKLMC